MYYITTGSDTSDPIMITNSFFSGSVTACDPHKIYYTDGVFDSAYVLIDQDSSIDAACTDDCVYTKYQQ